MPLSSLAQRARLQVRLDAGAKKLLQRAAGYSRTSLSQFVLSTALREAERIVERHEVITLTDAEWDRFYAALENPPEPNAALKEAYEQYRGTD